MVKIPVTDALKRHAYRASSRSPYVVGMRTNLGAGRGRCCIVFFDTLPFQVLPRSLAYSINAIEHIAEKCVEQNQRHMGDWQGVSFDRLQRL